MAPRILLVNGLAGSPRWWRRTLPALRGYEVAYADPRRSFDADASTVLVGHSLGGLRAAQHAAAHDVAKLVLVDPAGIPTGRRLVRGLLATVTATTPTFVPRVALDALRWGPFALYRYGREGTFARIDLATIRAPTLIVWGERDNLVPVRFAREWHEAIPGSRLEIIPRARHVPMVENASAFNEVLLDFLRDD